jgi:1-acyl-sn-glycerol-3-phosphate acyltransferase
MLYNIPWLIAYHIFNFFFVKEVIGLENMPKKGCIVALNHVSYLDPPILGYVLSIKLNNKVHFLAMTELFKPYFSRKLYNYFGAIPIDKTGKDKSWINASEKYLRKNEIIAICPEGGRSRDNKLQKGKTGIMRLALLAKVPIVPIGLIGTFQLFPAGSKMFKIKKIVKINIGKPIYFDKYYKRKKTKKLLRSLTNEVMDKIAKLSGQTYNK